MEQLKAIVKFGNMPNLILVVINIPTLIMIIPIGTSRDRKDFQCALHVKVDAQGLLEAGSVGVECIGREGD